MSEKKYTARISGVLSLIPETKIVLSEIAKGLTIEDTRKRVFDENILDKATIRSREKTFSAIKLRYLANQNIDKNSFITLMNSKREEMIKNLILYYHLSKAESIVYDITTKCLFNKFKEGNLGITKADILGFLEAQFEKHPELIKWTAKTRIRVAEHYLAIMKDFGFLKGRKKKMFNVPYVPWEVVLYVVYDLLQKELSSRQIIGSEDFKLFFIEKEELIRYMEEGSRKGIVGFKYRGNVYEIVPRKKNLRGYVNEITGKI